MQVSEFGMHIAKIRIENHFHINDTLIIHAWDCGSITHGGALINDHYKLIYIAGLYAVIRVCNLTACPMISIVGIFTNTYNINEGSYINSVHNASTYQ